MKTLFCAFGILVSANVMSTIAPTPGSLRVRPVFEKSDLVCNCFVESLTLAGERTIQGSTLVRRRMRAKVTIQDIYKTMQPRPRTIVVEFEQYWPATRVAEPGLWKGETALLFLKVRNPGIFEFTDRFLGATPFRSLPKQSGNLGLLKLEAALITVVLQGDREESIQALHLLHGFDRLGPNTMSKLAPLSKSKDTEIAFGAIAVLLRTKSPGALERLISYLNSYEGDDGPIWLASIDTDLAQVRDAGSLPLLEGLSDSKYRPIRRGAMDALRGIKSPKSAPTLVRRLDDTDSTIQYVAVISLAEILGKYEGDYAPGMPTFEKDPRKYTDLWKKWWAEHGKVR